MSSDQKDLLVQRLVDLPKASVYIVTINRDSQMDTLADDFTDVIGRLNWTLKSRSVSLDPLREPGIGVYVRSPEDHPAAADVLTTALRSMGFVVESGTAAELRADEIQLFLASQ